VVGIDPDPSHRTALARGADEADRRHLARRLVHAQGQRAGRYVERTLHEAVAFVEDRHPRLGVSALFAADDPVPVLCEQARTAPVVVLGSRRLSTRAELFTSAAVVLRRRCGRALPFRDRRRPRLRRCLPARRGAAGLYVWHPPLLVVLDEQAALWKCRGLLAATVAGRQAAHPDVEAHALVLIVGTRGHSDFTGTLPGSVVRGALHPAQCPDIAVPRLPGLGPAWRTCASGPGNTSVTSSVSDQRTS